MALSARCAYAYELSGQTITNATWTSATLSSEGVDSDDFHDLSTNTSRMTVPVSGTYLVLAHVALNGGKSHNRVRLRVNGTTVKETWGAEGFMTAPAGATIMRLLALSADDYVEVQVYHEEGGDRTAYGSLAVILLETGTPACLLVTGADQTPAQNTWTALTYASGDEEIDTDTMHDGSSNTSRITIKTAGYYLVFNAILSPDSGSHGPEWEHRVVLNANPSDRAAGSPLKGSHQYLSHPLTYANLASMDWCVHNFAVDDYVEHEVYAKDGTHRAISQSLFGAVHLGDAPNLAYIYNATDDNTGAAGSAWAELDFDSEWYDTGGGHDPSTNNSRVTLAAGEHLLLGKVTTQGSAGLDTSDGRTAKNATGYSIHGAHGRVSAGDKKGALPFAIISGAVDDYVELETKSRPVAYATVSNLLVTKVGPPSAFTPQIIRYQYR